MTRLFPDSIYERRKGETKAKLEERLWQPIRKGSFYCAPRCGCRCTWADYQLAKKRAAALCRLMGKGWVSRVWENGGWHYQVSKGTAEVYAHHYAGEPTSYSVWLQTEVGSIGGSITSMMQIILNVPVKKDGTSDILKTLKEALKLKRKAANTLLAEADAIDAEPLQLPPRGPVPKDWLGREQ